MPAYDPTMVIILFILESAHSHSISNHPCHHETPHPIDRQEKRLERNNCQDPALSQETPLVAAKGQAVGSSNS